MSAGSLRNPDQPDSGAGASAPAPEAISDAQPAQTLAEHEAEKQRIANEKAKNELGYGKVYAYGALVAMGVQVLIADGGFYLYGHAYGWKIPVAAIQVWLAATVVQVIGVVLVIAKSLFPSSDNRLAQAEALPGLRRPASASSVYRNGNAPVAY